MPGQFLQPIYGVFDVGTRYFYEDDRGGSSTSETQIDTGTDIAELRCRFNAYFALPKTIDYYRNNRYVIPADAMESNSGSGSGGGCVGTHRFVIHELPRLEVPGYEVAPPADPSALSNRCKMCGKEMDMPNDLASTNCGGDCLECMAKAGDPDAMLAIEQLRRKAAVVAKLDRNAEIRKLLVECRRLGLNFQRGSWYISRDYIDAQADLVQRIGAALKNE